MNIERNEDFFKQITVRYGFFAKRNIVSIRWDVNIGTKNIDENDFDATIPVYYTIDDEPENWRNVKYSSEFLSLENNLSVEIEKLYTGIIKRNDMSIKLRYAFNLLYSTLPFNNLDTIISTYATILETLLLGESESNQRKKVSVRSACLVTNRENFKSKEYIANWVYYFYKYRNAIVHDGKNYLELALDEPVVFEHTISLLRIVYQCRLVAIQYIEPELENLRKKRSYRLQSEKLLMVEVIQEGYHIFILLMMKKQL